MVELDEQKGVTALLVGGFAGLIWAIDQLGLDVAETAPGAVAVPVLVLLLGVYAWRDLPFDGVAIGAGALLLAVNLVGIVFGFGVGPSNFHGTIPGKVYLLVLAAAIVVALLAAAVDGLEEFA